MSSMNGISNTQQQQQLAQELAMNVIELVTKSGSDPNSGVNGVLLMLVQTLLQQLVPVRGTEPSQTLNTSGKHILCCPLGSLL